MRHVTQALPLGQGPLAARSDMRVGALCEATSAPDEMGQTGLALRRPGLLDTVAITDQETVPIVNECRARRGGATRIDAIAGGLWSGQAPEPREVTPTNPGRVIDIAHGGLAGDTGHGFRVGLEGQGDTGEDFLAGPQPDGAAEHRGTACLEK
jgi:hypothetical protein